MSIAAAIIGASGYSGAELLRLLADHPEIDVRVVTAETQAGQDVGTLYPHLGYYADLPLLPLDKVAAELAACGLVFCGLPHGEAMKVLPGLENDVIVDLGGDFRLDDPEEYEDWYGLAHAAPGDLADWTYGLPELFRADVKESDRIASPGCYPTASILAVAPLAAAGLIEGPVVIDAMSGTSGAGRAPKPNLHFGHVAEDVVAYKVGSHQHTPEIEMALERHAGHEVPVSFTAHLVPMVRGLHATCSAQIVEGATTDTVLDALGDAYDEEEFVEVGPTQLGTKSVRGSNMARLSATVDERVGRVIVTCVIDNLVKGAAGQAIQNANLALGIDEGAGLPVEALYP